MVGPPQETGIDILYGLKYDIAAALDAGKPVNPILDNAAQDLLRLIEEKVIGADEPSSYYSISSNPDIAFGPGYRNQLRASQRSKLRELLGGVE